METSSFSPEQPDGPVPSALPSAPVRRRRKDAGFTILEVAMASFVMAFGIATSIVAMQSGFRQIDLARGTTLASQILQSEIERLRLMSWTMIDALPSTETFDGATNFSSSANLVGKFSVTRTATDNAARPTEVKDIVVSVSWNTYDGMAHQRSFSFTYAKNGLYDYYYTVAHP